MSHTVHLCYDMQERFLCHKPGAIKLVRRINQQVAALREQGIPTLWIFYADRNGGYAPRTQTKLPATAPSHSDWFESFTAMKEEVNRFSPWHQELDVKVGDACFLKNGIDAFYTTPLRQHLTCIQAGRLLQSGVNAEPCVTAGAIGAIRTGFTDVAISLGHTLSDQHPDFSSTQAAIGHSIQNFVARRVAAMQAAETALDRGVSEFAFPEALLTGAREMQTRLERNPLKLLDDTALAAWLGAAQRPAPSDGARIGVMLAS